MANPPTLAQLIALERPVTVQELCAALPMLSERMVQHALRAGEIPGVRIGSRKWLVSRLWLIKLAE